MLQISFALILPRWKPYTHMPTGLIGFWTILDST